MNRVDGLRMIGLMLFLLAGDLVGGGPVAPRAESLPFEDCGSYVDLKTVQISSCTVAPCTIPINEPVTVRAEYSTNNQPTQELHHEAFWVLNTVNTRADVSPDPCAGANCPQSVNNAMGFSVKLLAPLGFPALHGTLYWRVYTGNNKQLICFRVPIALIR